MKVTNFPPHLLLLSFLVMLQLFFGCKYKPQISRKVNESAWGSIEKFQPEEAEAGRAVGEPWRRNRGAASNEKMLPALLILHMHLGVCTCVHLCVHAAKLACVLVRTAIGPRLGLAQIGQNSRILFTELSYFPNALRSLSAGKGISS